MLQIQKEKEAEAKAKAKAEPETEAEAKKRAIETKQKPPSQTSNTLPLYKGIQNKGYTCYINALLQPLYHMKKFRSIIIKTIDNETNSYVYWLKYIFHQLDQQTQASSNEIAILDFVRCFWSTVWDDMIKVEGNGATSSVQIPQQDIHEFLCKLFMDLPNRFKNESKETFQDLFSCIIHSEIVCERCQEKHSQQPEVTTNIQLPIAYDDNIMNAFRRKFGTVEVDE